MSSLDAKRRGRRPEGAEGTVCEAGGPRHQNGAEFGEKPVFDRRDTPRRTPTQSNTSVKDLGKKLAPNRRGIMRPCNRPHEAWKPPFWLLRDLPALLGIVWSFWSLMVMVISSGRRALGWDPRLVRPGQPDPIAHSSEVANRVEANPVRAAHARAAPSEETHELAGVAACSDWLSTCRAYGAGVAPSGSTTAFCCSGQTIGKGGGVVDVQSCQRNS